MRYKHPDLLKVSNVTIGKVFSANREDLLFTTDKNILCCKVKGLFEEAKINTPKSREILIKLTRCKNITSAICYIKNIIFKAANMSV